MSSDSAAPVVPLSSLRRNVVAYALGETLWSLGTAVVAPATVLIAFLRQHGAGDGAAGAIAAIEGGGALLQLAGPWLFRSHRRRKRQVLLWYAFAAVPSLALMAALTWLGGTITPGALRFAMLGAYALWAASLGAAIGVWMDWYGHLFDERVRAGVNGVGNLGHAVAGILGGIAAGAVLAALPSVTAYTALYVAALALCGVSLIAYTWIHDPSVADDTAAPRGSELMGLIAVSLRHRAARAYLVGRVLGNAALSTAPFIALRFLDAGLASATVVSAAIAISVGAALAAVVCGRIGDRRGHRGGLVVGLALAAIALLVALSARGVVGCVATYAMLGLATGAWGAGSFVAYESAPHGSRLAHLLALNLGQAAFGLVVPLAWAALAAGCGIAWVLTAALVVVLVALAWVLTAVPEPRAARPPLRPAADERRAA